ncbi:MAG: BtpA/SgcQ family protein [Candidatus Bipolaricaulota bacterium]|nr:BtpA/SgcQ family protein [Candidatus Bipolaricaulota bacterium]
MADPIGRSIPRERKAQAELVTRRMPTIVTDAMRLLSMHKPLVGMIHLLPMAGSVRYDRKGVRSILDAAMRDLAALEDGGADAVMVENFGDAPYAKIAPRETIAMMTAVLRAVVEAASVPIGVNVLRNDGLAALSIAVATGASFIRVNVLAGVAFTDQGIVEGQARELHALRRDLGADVEVLADVHVKHAAHLTRLEEAAVDTERNRPDALIVSGIGTGYETRPEDLGTVKRTVTLPVFVGSGVRADCVEAYRDADGFIVGTTLKERGAIESPVDEKRVRALATAIAALRTAP